jgi:asparaginyl-tRNA synthetase
LSVQEQLVSFIVQNTAKHASEELALLKINTNELTRIEPPFDRLTYAKAIETLRAKDFMIMAENGNQRTIKHGDDLNIDSERELTKTSLRPIFVIGYPLVVKPFYVKEDPQNKGMGLAADMLATQGFGEITSGGIREDDVNTLTKRIEKEDLDRSSYDWYIDLRRYGSVPHGGFGLGIERLVRWITNIKDIKDTVLFPRTMSRVTP